MAKRPSGSREGQQIPKGHGAEHGTTVEEGSSLWYLSKAGPELATSFRQESRSRSKFMEEARPWLSREFSLCGGVHSQAWLSLGTAPLQHDSGEGLNHPS